MNSNNRTDSAIALVTVFLLGFFLATVAASWFYARALLDLDKSGFQLCIGEPVPKVSRLTRNDEQMPEGIREYLN